MLAKDVSLMLSAVAHHLKLKVPKINSREERVIGTVLHYSGAFKSLQMYEHYYHFHVLAENLCADLCGLRAGRPMWAKLGDVKPIQHLSVIEGANTAMALHAEQMGKKIFSNLEAVLPEPPLVFGAACEGERRIF